FAPTEARGSPARAAEEAALDRAVRRARRGRNDGRPPGGLRNLAYGDRRGASGEAVTTAELKSKLERELAEDRLFLRKLRPGAIAARARGRRVDPVAPRAPQLPPREESAKPS